MKRILDGDDLSVHTRYADQMPFEKSGSSVPNSTVSSTINDVPLVTDTGQREFE